MVSELAARRRMLDMLAQQYVSEIAAVVIPGVLVLFHSRFADPVPLGLWWIGFMALAGVLMRMRLRFRAQSGRVPDEVLVPRWEPAFERLAVAYGVAWSLPIFITPQGARGFRFSGTFFEASRPGEVRNLYSKDSASGATFAYTLVDGDFTDGADMLRRLNAQGALGGVYRGLFAVGNAQTLVQVYEKHSLQSGAVEYHVEASPPPAEDPLRVSPGAEVSCTAIESNEQGAQGFFHLDNIGGSRLGGYTVYVKNAFDVGFAVWAQVFL